MSKPKPFLDFYEVKDTHGYLSNYYGLQNDKSFRLVIDGKNWSSTEHYYQAAKFFDSAKGIRYAKLIQEAKTPNIARVLATQKVAGGYKWRTDLNPLIEKSIKEGVKMRDDWDDVKDEIMYKAVKAKFEQNPKLRAKLMSTGDSNIREASPRDSYWGIGPNGDGKNRLGKILVQIRDILKE